MGDQILPSNGVHITLLCLTIEVRREIVEMFAVKQGAAENSVWRDVDIKAAPTYYSGHSRCSLSSEQGKVTGETRRDRLV